LVPTSKSPPLLRTIESVAKLQINKSFSTEFAHFNTNQQRKRARNADNQRRFYASVPERSVNTANSNTVLNTVNSNTVFNTTIPLSDKQQRTMKSVYQVCMRFLMEKMALSH
jgi:hypothetical protein